jgi:hypothetical protein
MEFSAHISLAWPSVDYRPRSAICRQVEPAAATLSCKISALIFDCAPEPDAAPSHSTLPGTALSLHAAIGDIPPAATAGRRRRISAMAIARQAARRVSRRG